MEEFRIVLADACKIVKESSRKRVISGADEDGRVMVEFSEPVGGRRVKMLTPDEINGMLYKEETAENPADMTEENPTGEQDTEQERGTTEESAFERIPKDEEGNPQYTQTDAPTAWDAIVEQTEGDEDMARSVVDSTVRDKEAALKKLESSNPKPGATVAEKIAAAKEHKAAIEAARQELEQWKAIAEVENSRKAEAEAKAKAEEEEAKAKAKAEEERTALKGVNLSEEKDENGNSFVVSSDGTTTFGEVRDKSGLPAAPIKLSVGYQDKNGSGYGLTHIEANHGVQIKKEGFASVEDFVSYVAKNYDENNIKAGKRRTGGSITYLLQVTGKHDNTLFIELSRDGSYWNVNSAGVFRKGYSDKKETVAKTEPQQPSNAISERALQSADQSNGILPASPNGKPTVSTSKVSESSETKQEKAEKSISAKVKEASADVNTEPTEAQREAGNYKKGHVQVGAFDITIEQPEGSIRRGTDADGKQWESKMHNTYGYFRGTEGVDGDHIDVFLSNDMDGWNGAQVFVVDQYNPDGTFDEHKVMLGFNDASDAKNNYLANYKKGWENGRRIDVSAVSLADFEKWIASSHRKTKPFSEYKSVKPADDSETFNGHKVENSGKDIEAQIKHLEEIKDYPGADKKIVQSEIDRLKAKEEATAKSKSEEVKSKSKEENGVDDAKIDAVLEALSKGDEKAEQLVQGLTSRELSKLRSKVKASPVLENEWLHRVGTRGGVSLHDWLLENQYVEPVKRVSGTFKMTDYTAPKNVYEGRLSGVYHDDKGYAVASDGIRLVADKGSYDPKLKGKVIGKDGVAMKNKFPNWQKVIPAAKETKSSRIDAEDLHRFVAGVLKADKHANISLRFPDGTTAAFNADKLNLMLRAMKRLGADKLLYAKDGMRLVAKSDKGAALLMWRVSAEDESMEEYGYAYPGNTVSYHRGEVVSEMSQEERVLRGAVIDRLRESGMEVITDEEAGQRVLDEANGKVRQMSFGEPYDYAAYPYGRVEPNLAEKEVNVVAADANHGFNNYKEAKTWAKQNVSKSYNDKETGGKGNVRISNAAIDKFLSQSAVDKSDSKDVHMAVLKVLPGLLKTSIDVETHPDFIKGEDGKRNAENGINKDVLVHRCYGAVSLDGKLYRVKITLKEDPRDLSFPHVTHSYEATKIELLAGTWENRKSPSPNTSNSITAAKLLENVGMSYNPGEKVLAASEKRSANIREHRVYHGSGADFDRFDHSHIGEGEGNQAFGWGTYVTEVEGIGRTYAEQNAQDVSPTEEDFEMMNAAISEKVLERFGGIDTELRVDYDGDGGFNLLDVPNNKEVLVKFRKYFENHPDEFDGYIEDYDLDDEYGRRDFADAVSASMLDFARKVAEDYKDKYLPTKQRVLYTVDIPDDNGRNYLDWDSRVGARVLSKVNKQLEKRGKRPINPELSKRYKFLDGNDLYRALSIRMPNDDATFNDDKAASEFLYSLGFVGIKYPADYMRGGREDGKKNYVIFDEKDAKITDRVRFFRTAKGEAYGFTVGGKIYIDPKIANTETPIHEYAHLWAAALRGQNPKEWRNIVELMKGTSVWDEVKKRYPELNTDDDIADEVLATYSGRRGAERLREEQRKIAGDKGGVFEKAEAISALERVKQALRKFWKSVADFLHIHYKSAEEVADRVMKDLLDGVDPGKHFNSRNDDPRFMFAGEKGAARADRGEEALTRQNNLDAAQKMEATKKEAKAIKLATGWERGADGKWRYEIPDGIYHPKGDAELKKALAKQPWREELNGLSDRILDGEGLSKEETERFNELAEKEAAFKADYLKKEKPHLADWLENDGLFKAYPELKRVGIVFTDNMPKEQAGYYDSKSNTITVNTNSSEDTASIIAHEVQHAIQRYEGFATGGNLKAAMEYLSGNKRADVKIKQQLAYKLSQEKGLGLSEEEVNSLIGHLEYEDEAVEDKTKFRLLDADDPKAMELESLPESELVPVYRNAQAFEDDALGSPMAFTDAETGERRTLEGRRWNYSAPPKVELTEEQQRKLDELNKKGYIMVDGKKSTELQINDGLKFVKPKTKEAQLQYFLKKNPEDKGLWAAYDPYDHAIETPLNTQFGEAYKRPNLVVVRSLIPKSEIDEPFHADYALLPTGAHQWNNGRTLYLSRWSKIDKVLTREEEAKLIDEYWKKHPGKREELKTHRDYNRFVPQVRRELEKMGYRFELDGKELTPEESLALDKQNWENRDIIPGREGHTPFVSNEDIARINAKMAGKWVGEPKEAMESAMSERVTELSERLHTPVRIIRTEEEVAALPSVRQRRMKGSFNPMTGEVSIVVPNNANMADVENTFVHEVVGHDGMRVLFPDEAKLNNALDELYRVSKDEIRGTIDRMAQKMYDAEVDRIREKKRKEHLANGEDANASYYADMAAAHAEAGKKREQFKRDATEEYGADLAGRIGEKGFEKMSAEELTFWGKLKAMLQKALQKLLDGLKIPGKRKWGDKDWAFVLHEAYKRKKNGGKPTVFDAADTEVMRRKTGFDETKFSDGKNKSSEPKPIGHSTFGSVYNQFKGKVLQAVKFLLNHESGDLLGVFHRNDVGDIDMVWGDEGGGLCHILNKHINDKDFPTVKDLVSRIEDIINKGEVDERHSNADKLVLVKDGYLVTIRRNVREKGIKIADKNWVLTAYNKDAPATTKAPVDGTYGSTAVAPGTSSDAKLATKSEINEFSDNNVADEGVMFRGGKELRDGRKIEFVRKPTATYNALARHLQAEGIKPDMHEARTGSRYMSFEKDGVQWEVRSSDHTKPEYYGEAQKPVELTYYMDKQGEENLSVSVDLGTSGYNIEDMKALMAEIDRLKNDAGEVKESFDRGVASNEVVERYPLLSQALGVKSENEVRAKEEAREHAEEARKQEMRSAVEDMAGKLHLNNVDIVDKPAGRGAGRRERAKGMFERSTGRITINIGNCADKRDAVVTLLHEAVAHHGLRKLFGENFETFLGNVYNSANAEIRRIIDKHSSRYGGDKRTATEEYMASLAERTDFENAKKSGWWQRIKDFFLKMLEKIGLKGFKGEDLSDNELRYVLWRSYENLKSGGKDTVFSAADDLAKQSEFKVGEFTPDAKSEGSVAALNTRFNNELQQQIDGNLPSNHIYQMGNPGQILRSTGVPDLPIQMNAKRLQDKATLFDHNFELYEVKDLVKALQNPLAVFSYGDKTKAQNIIVPLQKDGKNFIVGLSLNPTVGGKALEINSIRNVFPKDNSEWLNWISQGKALYLDKEKIQTLIAQQRTNLADVEYLDLDSAAKVVENFENPKPESKNDALFRDGAAKDYEKAQARETYERRVSTDMFQSREAIQDSMLSLKVAMDAIEEATAGKAKRIEDYDGFENAYLGENRLSSVNQAESAAFAHLLIRPMM